MPFPFGVQCYNYTILVRLAEYFFRVWSLGECNSACTKRHFFLGGGDVYISIKVYLFVTTNIAYFLEEFKCFIDFFCGLNIYSEFVNCVVSL